MRQLILALVLLLLPLGAIHAGEAPKQATLYKNPQCGCCEEYAKHLREHGFAVSVVERLDLPLVKTQHGVPEALAGCHTTLIDGYVVEGHVPLAILDRLLAERPAIRGISLPGMPTGSPGMPGPKSEPFTIYAITDGPPTVYAVE